MNRRSAALAAVLFLAGCVSAPQRPAPPIGPRPVPTPSPAPTPANALTAGIARGPALSTLPISAEQADRALAAFRISCSSLLRRNDTSGIGADWRPACDRARTETDARAFFATAFETARIGPGTAMATGYYEPEIAASRDPQPGYVPIYRMPADLVEQQVPVCPPQADPLALSRHPLSARRPS